MKQFMNILAIVAAMFVMTSICTVATTFAGEYPAGNIEAIASIEDSADVHIPIVAIDVFVYDSLYQSETSKDGQVVRGTIVLYLGEGESLRFDLYGEDNPAPKKKGTSDYFGNFNHAIVVYTDGDYSEVVVRNKKSYGPGLYESGSARERIAYIKISREIADMSSVLQFKPYVVIANTD